MRSRKNAILMHKIKYRIKKKGKSNFVWLQKSNKYINLKNPAFDIFQLLAKNTSNEIIYRYLTDDYGFTIETCRQFVTDFENEIARINVSDKQEIEIPVNLKCSNYNFEPYFVHTYQFGEKAFSISYEDKFLENWLHPIIDHLNSEPVEILSFHFEVFNCEGKIVFREKSSGNNKIYPADNIFQQLANKLFDKSDNDWLLKAHASAVTNHKKTVLFSGSSGSGKTTLAALLLQKGFDLVSDDLVLFDKKKRAYGFPSAMSVKNGALKTLSPIYPELDNKTEIHLSPEKKVRYLNTNSGKKEVSKVYQVNEVVFVKYNPKIDFKLSKISCSKGIKSFLKQAYISPNPVSADTFLDWAVNVSFYNLTYSESDIAMDAMLKLFENE
jgi:hypothetical protein